VTWQTLARHPDYDPGAAATFTRRISRPSLFEKPLGSATFARAAARQSLQSPQAAGVQPKSPDFRELEAAASGLFCHRRRGFPEAGCAARAARLPTTRPGEAACQR
jgi:hypothetical protein